MPPQNHRRRHRRKRTPTRFISSAAPPPPSPPHQEVQQAPPEQPQIQETPPAVLDSDDSGTDPDEYDEVITVSLSEVRSNVQCAICLGVLKSTRAVMGCLHRFCKECIDKSMRLGNKECPACRKHCASRRSLRDDLVFDKIIGSLFPDLEKYEKELQASINGCHQRQAEGRKPRKGKVAAARVDRECSRQSGSKLKFGGPSNGGTSGMIYKDDHHQPPVSAIPSPCIVADQVGAEGASSPAKTNLPGWGGAGFRSQARRAATGKGTQSSRVERLAEHLANVEKSDNKHVVTTHLQSDKLIWLKDCNDYALADVELIDKAEAKAPHISKSVLDIVRKRERLLAEMKN
ncbi:putative E3 ubiquitin-protein ligase RING1b isoform X2 [Salvia hispanica]|uniref:putative E3 ubiquitin-protein ligase RING1b isoform X2 n=1 Tax=Salvia hispanica TaxID=49212 RepID=UPI0020099133|nr:putative E3 ubiquitin-protein ligase RING1b isoform X2 [Salvia hispanica]XP_047948497.1 putative E3 ubiquitin-protein ligase RING1b isoform X2 [Salvia hispanica]